MTDAEQKVRQNYCDRFQAYVQPKSNPVFARYKLHSKVQEPGETCQQLVTALKLLVRDCEYGQTEDDIVRDRIVFGTKSAKVREELIDTGADLTLEKAIEIARVEEIAVQRLKEMKDEPEQERRRNRLEDRKTQSTYTNIHKHTQTYTNIHKHVPVVGVVGNMVMLIARPWVKSSEVQRKESFWDYV